MANMRVHELAKELNITSKDITDMLSNSEKTYKPVSGLTDAEISSVRKKFAPAPKAENKPAAQPAKQSQPVKNDNRLISLLTVAKHISNILRCYI